MSTLYHQISQLEEKYNFRKALYPLLHLVFVFIAFLSLLKLYQNATLPPNLIPGVGGNYMPWTGLVTSLMGILWFAWDQSSMRKSLEDLRAIEHNQRGERYASLSIQRSVVQRSLRSRRVFQVLLGLPGVLFCLAAVGSFIGGITFAITQPTLAGLGLWLVAAFYGGLGYGMTKTAWNLTKEQRIELHKIEDELMIIQLTQKAKPGDMSIAADASSGGELTDVTHAKSGQLTDAQHHTEDEVVLDFETQEQHQHVMKREKTQSQNQ